MRDARAPLRVQILSFNFMQFLWNFGKTVCWRPPPPPEGWRPHLGEILDPPLLRVSKLKKKVTSDPPTRGTLVTESKYSGLYALFTRNVCVCVYVKRQKWVLWQQMMVFTLNICIFKDGTAKITKKPGNVDVFWLWNLSLGRLQCLVCTFTVQDSNCYGAAC